MAQAESAAMKMLQNSTDAQLAPAGIDRATHPLNVIRKKRLNLLRKMPELTPLSIQFQRKTCLIKRPDPAIDPLLKLLKVLVPCAQIPFSLQRQDFPAAVGRPHRFAFDEVP